MTRPYFVLIALLILLGNGLRSVIASSIFMSEASFASFLSITVEATAAVTELLMGAVLVSLLLAPWLMHRAPAMHIALAMTGLAALASFGIAAIFQISPPVDLRIAGVMVLFPLLGFALATLAPISQGWTGLGSVAQSKTLLGMWSLAMPLAFLITPQLVRVVAPRFGLDTFFAGFALVVLAMMPLLWRWRGGLDRSETQPGQVLGGRILLAVLGAVLAFQAVTITVSLDGLKSPAAPLLCGVFLLSCWLLWWAKGARLRRCGNLATPALFLSLFLLNVATTGFFDTSFLVRHSCSNTLIADRATLAALAQVAAATLTTALLVRFAIQRALIATGLLVTALGLAGYLAYPGAILLPVLPMSENAWFIVTRMLTGFGTALATTAIIFALTAGDEAGRGAAPFVAFVIIIGTEFGLESFEVASQATMLISDSTVPPYGAIFAAQVVVALLALAPLAYLSKKTADQSQAPQPGRA